MKFFITSLLISTVASFSINAHATYHEKVQLQDTEGNTFYLIKHAEDSRYFIDLYKLEPGKLQTRVDSFSSRSKRVAEDSFARMRRRYRTSQSDPVDVVETEMLNTQIWQTRHFWNQDWEDKYTRWISEEMDARYFLADNDVATDCADAAIAFRWIFARIHGLPAGQQLAGSGVLFSNESMRRAWRNLPTASRWQDDRLFRAALDYVLNNTYTHSLMTDSYPIEINRYSLKPGAHHLELWRESGHTLVVAEVDVSAPSLKTVNSTVPRTVRNLRKQSYWRYSQAEARKSGFLRIRWPQRNANGRLKLRNSEDMPFYSTEQYDSNFLRNGRYFYEEVLYRINSNGNVLDTLRAALDDLKGKFEERTSVVEDGYNICRNADCSPGTANYYDWSTPSRDSYIEDYRIMAEEIYGGVSGDSDATTIWNSAMTEEIRIKGLSNVSLSLEELLDTWENNTYSSDPRDSIEDRWGL